MVKDAELMSVAGADRGSLKAERTKACECRLTTRLGALNLCNPLIAASGTAGYGRELKEWGALDAFGGLSVKGTTLAPRDGNISPRIAECSSSLINAVGLQNPGIEKVTGEELPWLRANYGGLVLANISGFSLDEYAACAEKIGPALADIIEVNISCPNVHGGGMAFGTDPKAAAQVTRTVRERTELPVFVKLSPNVSDITKIAAACEDAGADGICLINTVSAMRIDIRSRRPLLGNVTGGLSGPALFPLAVRMVWQCAHKVSIPIIGCGGVSKASDVVEMMMAGASAVEIGSATLVDPFSCAKITNELPALMDELKINNIQDIIGVC